MDIGENIRCNNVSYVNACQKLSTLKEALTIKKTNIESFKHKHLVLMTDIKDVHVPTNMNSLS